MMGTMHKGSIQSQVAEMNVGDVRWIETTPEKCAHIQRQWGLAKSRRSDETKDFVMECTAWHAVPVGKIGEAKVLVRVERVR